MIDKYELYLQILSVKLQKFFEQQKPYIFCKEGCSLCCETGAYPFSKLEFDYLMIGFNNLDEKIKKNIYDEIKEIKAAKEKSGEGDNFMYKCPFLIDKKCCVYQYRGIICRTFGLPYYTEDNRIKIPHCVNEGLNYASVCDPETGIISAEKFKQTGFEQEPLSYNLSLKFLLNNETTRAIDIDFGAEKALIDWFD